MGGAKILNKIATIPIVAFAFGVGSAHAQQFDGVWTGTAGLWGIQLTVKGTKGTAKLSCGSNDFVADIPVGADGTIDAYVTTGAGRRQVTGKLPMINWPTGGPCQGGVATMTKK